MQRNYIGTDVNGTADLGNTTNGVYLQGTGFNTVGGTSAASRNIISGNDQHGVFLDDGSTGVLIQGNYIGTDVNGTLALANTGDGVNFNGASSNTVGGTAAGAGNTIANNGGDGIRTNGTSTGNDLLGNSIHTNTGLGIDNDDDDVTGNDAGDGDTGGNQLQNFPVLTGVNQGSTIIDGTLNSTVSTTYRLEFFSNTACDASGNGEGETFLGTQDVTTDGTGNVTFQVTLTPTAAVGSFVTATATDPANNTSEFSACQTVAGIVPTFSEWTMILLAMTMAGWMLWRMNA